MVAGLTDRVWDIADTVALIGENRRNVGDPSWCLLGNRSRTLISDVLGHELRKNQHLFTGFLDGP